MKRQVTIIKAITFLHQICNQEKSPLTMYPTTLDMSMNLISYVWLIYVFGNIYKQSIWNIFALSVMFVLKSTLYFYVPYPQNNTHSHL